MTSVDSNFNFQCGRPHGAGPPEAHPPVHMRPPEPDPLPPPCGRHKWMAPNVLYMLYKTLKCTLSEYKLCCFECLSLLFLIEMLV